MARVTVEDCIREVPNRFDLVILSSQRARQLSGGASITVDRDNDKNSVVALREIADKTIEPCSLKESIILGMQRHIQTDDLENQLADILSEELSMTNDLMTESEEELLILSPTENEETSEDTFEDEEENEDFSHEAEEEEAVDFSDDDNDR